MITLEKSLIRHVRNVVVVREPTAVVFPWRLYAEFMGERFLMAFSDNEDEIRGLESLITSVN